MIAFDTLRYYVYLFILAYTTTNANAGCKLPLARVVRQKAKSAGSIFSTKMHLTNSQEITYLIPIRIGGQFFDVILDTGSSDLWVVSSQCINYDCSGVKKYYNTSTSLRMSEEAFKLKYLLGSVTGNVGFETVTMGTEEVLGQAFALANYTDNLDLSVTGNSGILGMGFPSISAISPLVGKSLLESLFSSASESERYFAFRLGRDGGSNSSVSSFTFGQLDPAIGKSLAEFSFTPVSKAGADDYNYWKLPIKGLSVNSSVIPLSPSLVPQAQNPIAVLDTGTTLILGPTSDVNAFWEAVNQGGTVRKNHEGFWEVRCDRGVIAKFILGESGSEKEYTVHPRDISWAEGGSVGGWCLGGIQANDHVNSGDWLLGDVFLRNVYVTHHGANSTHPPLIGLLGTTDPTIAMTEFRQERGVIPLVPQLHGTISRASSNSVSVYTLSSICGFVSGAALTTIFCSQWGSKPEKVVVIAKAMA